MSARLDHLNLSVSDLETTVGWYDRVFGFVPVERGEQDGEPWCILRSGNSMLCLYQHPDRRFLDGDGLEAEGLHGFNHFGLRIDNEAAWQATMQREGIEPLYGGPVRWPHSTAWYIQDPTGYKIEVALWDDDRVTFG